MACGSGAPHNDGPLPQSTLMAVVRLATVADDDRGLVSAGGGDLCQGCGDARCDGVAGFAISDSGTEIAVDDPGLQYLGAAGDPRERRQHHDRQAQPLPDDRSGLP
jgi:hypothetical protein